jgi:hypothetical protein
VAWWIGVHSAPGGAFPAHTADLKLTHTGIRAPVLIDVVSGAVTPLHWKEGSADTLAGVPLRDSIMAVADASWFDWPILPEAPSGLTASVSGGAVTLRWTLHGEAAHTAVERRSGNTGPWQRIASPGPVADFDDTAPPCGSVVCYRVRAVNAAGESAYSNIARVPQI